MFTPRQSLTLKGSAGDPLPDVFQSLADAGTRFLRGQLCLIAAAAGSGKSALVLSYATSEPAIALASATAFFVSELIDWLVFSITRRPLRDRLWLSSALSIPVDTFIFFGMIGALTPAVIGTAMASKFAGVTAVWLAMAFRARRAAVAG